MGVLDALRSVTSGVAQAAGADGAHDDLQAQLAASKLKQQQAQQFQLAPLSMALKADHDRLALYADPSDPSKAVAGHEDEYNDTLNRMSDTIGQMRQVYGGKPPSEDPNGLQSTGAHLLDKLHITRDLASRLATRQSDKVNGYYQQNRELAGKYAEGVPVNPYIQESAQLGQAGLTPQEQQQAVRAKAGILQKDTTSEERFLDDFMRTNPGKTMADALRAYTDATTKDTSGNKAPLEPKPLEIGGVLYGVTDPSTGKQYLSSQMADPATPPYVKELWNTVQTAQTKKQTDADRKEAETQARFNQQQERLERMHNDALANLGSWSVVEGEDGKTQLLNSKSGETKEAPAGLHKSGFYVKNIAPLEAANLNMQQYMDEKQFSGSGDLSLQHEFFTATQPSSGFRMTGAQQKRLDDGRDWINSRKGEIYHALYGTWFTPEQRQELVKTAQEAIANKKKVLSASSGGPATNNLRQIQSGQGWAPPADAPPAPKEDNKVLKADGKVIAKSKGGQWVNPSAN